MEKKSSPDRKPNAKRREVSQLAVAPSMLYRYLLGAMPQAQLSSTVRFAATPEEIARLPEILEA